MSTQGLNAGLSAAEEFQARQQDIATYPCSIFRVITPEFADRAHAFMTAISSSLARALVLNQENVPGQSRFDFANLDQAHQIPAARHFTNIAAASIPRSDVATAFLHSFSEIKSCAVYLKTGSCNPDSLRRCQQNVEAVAGILASVFAELAQVEACSAPSKDGFTTTTLLYSNDIAGSPSSGKSYRAKLSVDGSGSGECPQINVWGCTIIRSSEGKWHLLAEDAQVRFGDTFVVAPRMSRVSPPYANLLEQLVPSMRELCANHQAIAV